MSIQVKRSFKQRWFVFSVWGVMLGFVGTVEAQFPIPAISKQYATYGNFSNDNAINVFSHCDHIAFNRNVVRSEEVEIPVSANQNDTVSPWIELSHSGWSCRRTFIYSNPYQPSQILPECAGHNSMTNCWPVQNTRTRHWLTGIISSADFVRVQGTIIDGYTVYRGVDWVGSHNMAGLGFILKWETNVNGTLLEFPINLPLIGDIRIWGPTVEVNWMNQIAPNSGASTGSNYEVTDTKVSFRIVLLDPNVANIKNSDNNIVPVTRGMTLGLDNCQPDPNKPNCDRSSSILSDSIDFTAYLNVRHQNPTCVAENLTVPMGTIPLTSFLTTNAVAGETFFEIKLTCARVIRRNLDYSLSA